MAVERKVGAGFLIASLRSVRSVPWVREARAQHRGYSLVRSKSFQMRLAEINNQVNRPYMLRDRVCDTVEGMSSQGPKVRGKGEGVGIKEQNRKQSADT